MSEVKEKFKPNAVVCQCGVDTLAGDPMASFNLTQHSIGECVRYLMEWNLPLLLLGGGEWKMYSYFMSVLYIKFSSNLE